MKKIKRKFLEWFFNKTLYKFDEGGFEFRVTKFFIDIKAKSGNFKLRLDYTTYTYGYLVAALGQGLYEQVHGLGALVYNTAIITCTDQGLIDDLQKSFAKYTKRMEEKAENIANEITPDEDKLNEEVVKANIEVAKMSKAERKAHKESIRDVLNEKDNK